MAVSSRTDARQGKLRRPLCQMLQHGALQLDEPAFASGVHDLEHEAAPVRRGEVEVVIVLAGERAGAGREVVDLAGHLLGIGSRENPATVSEPR